MISKFPDESDTKRPEAEAMAKAVTAVAYAGESRNFFPLCHQNQRFAIGKGGSDMVSSQ